jgi:hypothetical protein
VAEALSTSWKAGLSQVARGTAAYALEESDAASRTR